MFTFLVFYSVCFWDTEDISYLSVLLWRTWPFVQRLKVDIEKRLKARVRNQAEGVVSTASILLQSSAPFCSNHGNFFFCSIDLSLIGSLAVPFPRSVCVTMSLCHSDHETQKNYALVLILDPFCLDVLFFRQGHFLDQRAHKATCKHHTGFPLIISTCRDGIALKLMAKLKACYL